MVLGSLRLKPGRRHVPQPRCDLCCLFMSWRYARSYAVRWTPFGGREDIDPPEEEFAHMRCWNQTDAGQRALIRRIAWIGPTGTREKVA